MDRKRVGIVGAGVSGLAACKHALDKGFSPVVFEADDTIGGVWAHTLESTRLQAPTTSFRFSDLVWPAGVTTTYPGHRQVMEYLRLYAHEFDILKCIKFNSQVLGVEYFGATEEEIMGWEHWSGDDGKAFGVAKDRGWSLTVKDLKNGNIEVFQVDFLILCIGRHSGTPNIPEFPANKGPEFFKGKILHSMDYSYMDNAAEFVKGRSVTIIGSGKSAFDIAAEVAKVRCFIWLPVHLRIKMPREWMYCAERKSDPFKNGVNYFLDKAKEHAGEGTLFRCPCVVCKNAEDQNSNTIRYHLVENGFVKNYKLWTHHGETKEDPFE